MNRSMGVSWVKCGSVWCDLELVNLENVAVNGVYIIWRSTGPTVYVGQGSIRERLEAHRSDPSILAYKLDGRLHVTWAAVFLQSDRDSIERYLSDQLRPFVGKVWPNVSPIAVNLPQ